VRTGRSAVWAAAAVLIGAGAASAALRPAPTLRVSPRSGPVGTVIHVSGAAPAGRPCPFIRVTVGRPAGGAANVLRVYRLVRRRYAGSFRAPSVSEPTTPPSIARTVVVRAACGPSRHEVYARTRDVSVTFRVLGALSP